ncbi:MAG: oxaloacetate decarboxylase subunit alpha [Candidatus Methanomethylicota archaeon]|jgi:pyruvate carboxylase subunit B|uniref:Oxaloacetate decarboxylase subunit alpha n=1 Tax=Thermoproteota archaeon TaxID=2056631 RepID=A0A523BE83_9CREN|nr:MAG: oxaloacetate decarboxylase subunit alpha [Candidatus Verstraetearchaeota archaeon]
MHMTFLIIPLVYALLKVIDTTIRDGQQSLFATRVKIEDILPVLEKMDQVGFYGLEAWGGATFDACMRYLNEDPWDRLRRIKRGLKRTKVVMLLRGKNLVGYKHYPDEVVEEFVKKAFENGVDVFRIFDALNDVNNLRKAVSSAKSVGAEVHGDVVYTISPIHTVDHFIEVAKKIAELGVDAIRIKDMAGLLAPRVAYDIVRGIRKETGLPVGLHCHYTCGLASLSYMKGIEAGAEFIDTALFPFAFGASQPAIETIYEALRGTGHLAHLNIELINECADYFESVREKYRGYTSDATERIDPRALRHQIPGGMLSNLVVQLKEYNALSKLELVLKEVPIVRRDLGYPPLVTPMSQIVGTQAVMNVITGVRYGMLIKELENYVRGFYGRPPGEISRELMDRVKPADPPKELSFKDIPEDVRNFFKKEEDALTYLLFPQIAVPFLKGDLKTLMPNAKENRKDIKWFRVKIGDEEIEVKIESES